MNEAQAIQREPAAAATAAAGPVCEVCGQPGAARVCGCDAADVLCHLSPCDAVCSRCAGRASATAAAAAPGAPHPVEPVQPCEFKQRLAQETCRDRAADAEAALAVYKALKIDRHSVKSFAADVLLGSFENVRLTGEVALGNEKLDDFRHISRCWTCSAPQPRSGKQWCIHPREMWTLREKAPETLEMKAVAAQIGALEKAQDELLRLVPPGAREIVRRRLQQMIEVAVQVRGNAR